MTNEYRLTANRSASNSTNIPRPASVIKNPWLVRPVAASCTPWLAYHQPLPGARLRLFCFPHAGGGASLFRQWAELLQPYQVELCPVQLPGRETRDNEKPYTNLNRLLAALQKALAPYTDLPFAFLGHSMGGLLAFHLAQTFQQSARPLQRLIISSATPPRFSSQPRPIEQLGDGAFLQEVARYNGLPIDLLQDRARLAQLLPALRADFILCERAAILTPTVLHCPLSIFSGVHDQSVHDSGLVQWRQHTLGLVKMHKFPGDHFFLYRPSDLVVKAIVQDLFSIAV